MRTRHDIYLDILQHGLLHIRAHVADADRCLAEVQHIHNLPNLLREVPHEDVHRYYWEATRAEYLSSSKPEWHGAFTALWAELQEATKREAVA